MIPSSEIVADFSAAIQLLGYDTYYPGVSFKKPSSEWIEIIHNPNKPLQPAIGYDAYQLSLGMFTVFVCSKNSGNGIIKINETAEAIIAAFPKGTVIGGVKVSKNPYALSVQFEQGENRIPVTIAYSE